MTRVDRRLETGPFDIIGDIHGCGDELEALLSRLGYAVRLEGRGESRRAVTSTPAGRRAVFLGDYVDRGPRSLDVLRVAMAMMQAGQALGVMGNHDVKLLRWLGGRNVQLTHGLAQTVDEIEAEPAGVRAQIKTFLDGLEGHMWLDGGRVAVAHAGLRRDMLGLATAAARAFSLYGDTTGARDEFGLPVRRNWAAHYRGGTAIVYGHTPVADAVWQNNTICVDTGCCFGGKLTALRWPERELVSVPAARVYAVPTRPLGMLPAPAGEG